jgi:hypothetical protein
MPVDFPSVGWFGLDLRDASKRYDVTRSTPEQQASQPANPTSQVNLSSYPRPRPQQLSSTPLPLTAPTGSSPDLPDALVTEEHRSFPRTAVPPSFDQTTPEQLFDQLGPSTPLQLQFDQHSKRSPPTTQTHGRSDPYLSHCAQYIAVITALLTHRTRHVARQLHEARKGR